MNIIEGAIWQVESNLRTLMSLEAIADRIGVTPSYLTRAFTLVTGHSLMRPVPAVFRRPRAFSRLACPTS